MQVLGVLCRYGVNVRRAYRKPCAQPLATSTTVLGSKRARRKMSLFSTEACAPLQNDAIIAVFADRDTQQAVANSQRNVL